MKTIFQSIALRISLGIFAILTPIASHAAKEPTSVQADKRIKQVIYNPNQVYEITGAYFVQTAIEFAANEKIKVVSQGDSVAWQIKRPKSVSNILFLKPTEDNAAANLTVITDKRKYFFNLTTANRSASKTFLVRFTYPTTDVAAFSDGDQSANAAGLSLDKLNMNYSTSGDSAGIGLAHAFDDGEFTFFKFKPDAEVPAIYMVGPDGTESLVNTRRENNFYVVERTASLFTLRNGSMHLCVRNNAKPYRAAEKPVGRSGKGLKS